MRGIKIMSNVNLKCITIGDLSVGKTSMILRYTKDQFTQGYIPTIGADFTNIKLNLDEYEENNILFKEDSLLSNIKLDKKVYQTLNEKYNDETNKVFMWDLAGQPNFKKIRNYYMSNAFFAIIVLDLSNPDTYDISVWIKELKQASPNCDFMIVGNKLDLVEPSELKTKVQKLQKEIESKYKKPLHLISAKSGDGIKRIFTIMKINIMKKIG
jgi:small GTP-binding protein